MYEEVSKQVVAWSVKMLKEARVKILHFQCDYTCFKSCLTQVFLRSKNLDNMCLGLTQPALNRTKATRFDPDLFLNCYAT